MWLRFLFFFFLVFFVYTPGLHEMFFSEKVIFGGVGCGALLVLARGVIVTGTHDRPEEHIHIRKRLHTVVVLTLTAESMVRGHTKR